MRAAIAVINMPVLRANPCGRHSVFVAAKSRQPEGVHDGSPLGTVRLDARPIQGPVHKAGDFVRHRLRDEVFRVRGEQPRIQPNPVLKAMGATGAPAAQIPLNGRQFKGAALQGLCSQARLNDPVFHSAKDLIGHVHSSGAASQGGYLHIRDGSAKRHKIIEQQRRAAR